MTKYKINHTSNYNNVSIHLIATIEHDKLKQGNKHARKYEKKKKSEQIKPN
jgi:hypothetical protein